MIFPFSWEWNNHPKWRTPSFFVAKNHQPLLIGWQFSNWMQVDWDMSPTKSGDPRKNPLWQWPNWHCSIYMGMDQYLLYNTIFSGMNIHLPAILMFTRGTRFWHTAPFTSIDVPLSLNFALPRYQNVNGVQYQQGGGPSSQVSFMCTSNCKHVPSGKLT